MCVYMREKMIGEGLVPCFYHSVPRNCETMSLTESGPKVLARKLQ